MAQITNRGANTWQVRVYLGKNILGKRKFYTKTIHGTKAEAKHLAYQMEAQYGKGKLVEGRATFGAAWERYMKACEAEQSPNTLRIKRQVFQNYFQVFMDVYVDAVTTYQLQEFVNSLLPRFKPSFIKNVVTVLKTFFNVCMSWKILATNPCKGLILPKGKGTLQTIKPLTDSELAQFINACADSPYGLFFRLQLLTGARTSEIRALCWDCVDFEAKTVLIKRGFDYDNNKIQDRVKTETSRREIALDDLTMEYLRKLRLQSASPLVFQGRGCRNPVSLTTLQKELYKILDCAGIQRERFRMYDLRHTCATYLLRSGVPVRAVADRLGHSSAKMTLDVYNHATLDLEPIMYRALVALDEKARELRQSGS